MSNITVLPAKRELVSSVKFHDLRLPYDDAFAEGFGIDNLGWKVLIDTVYPAAKSVEAIAMALSYCKQRNLDPFKRPVHIVPMYSAAKAAMVETVWPGISELRTTATRTSEYAGCDGAEFGETIRREFKGSVEKWVDRKKTPVDVAVTVEFPEWCQMTIYRVVKGQRCKFVGDKVYWVEAYARQGKADVPNDMWCKRPVGQLQKCAEAAALRRAFPEEIGNEYTAEEMEGQVLFGGSVGETDPPKRLPPAPPPPPPSVPSQPSAERAAATPPASPPGPPGPPPPPSGKAETPRPPSPPPAAARPQGFDFDRLRRELRAAPSPAVADEIYDRLVNQNSRHIADAELEECDNIVREAYARFGGPEE